PAVRALLGAGWRALPLLRLWRRAGGPGFAPRFRTAALEVRIDLHSGAIDGQVLQGRHAGAPPPEVDRPDEDEAWRILGLEPGASREDILRAHKRLMQRLHPDRGGNDYLAAKVNAARDLLLERR
ncbi:MAG: hypothetical protein ACOY42_07200, partial [Pseudomonadota bacterium]